MRPVTVTQTGVGNTAPIPMDIRLNPANIAVQVDVTGTVTYVVESTDSDIWDTGATLLWTPHPEFAAPDGAPKTVDWVGNYAFPPTAIRLSVTGGDGSAQMRVVQSGH